MKLIKAVDAYLALGILAKEQLPFGDSLKISAQRKQLKPLYDFFAEEEQKIVCEVSKKDNNGKAIRHSDGHFEFENEASKQTYHSKMSELSTFEIGEVDIIKISPPEKISADIIEALEDIVIFEEEEKNESPS